MADQVAQRAKPARAAPGDPDRRQAIGEPVTRTFIAPLTVFVLLYSALLGCWGLLRTARRVRLGGGYLGSLLMLEVMLLLRAGLELAGLVRAGGFGRGYAEPVVHAGYLVASVAVLPLVLAVTRLPPAPGHGGPDTDAGRARESAWDGAVAVVGCLAVAVVTIRMNSTGRAL